MKIQDLLLSLLLIVLVTSCSGPQKLYEKGRYDKAYDKALSKLKEGKDRKLKILVNKAFSKLIDQTRDELIDLNRNFDLSDADRNLKRYDEVGERFEAGEMYLTDENGLKFLRFRAEKEGVVADVYEGGLAFMDDYKSSQRKADAREAFAYFSLVDKYCNTDYPKMDELLNDSFEAGTVIYNVNVDLNFDQTYRWEVNRKFDDLEGSQGFTRIVYDRPGNVGDCLVELDFDSLDEDIQESTSTKSYSEKIEDGYTTKIDTSGQEIKVPKYITVTGNVTTRRITKKVRWRVNLDVRSMNGDCNLKEERFSVELVNEVDQYEISGDERAVPSQYTRNNDKLVSTDDMVDDLIDELYRDIYKYLY
ncbi:MAG: hypothetical protein ACJATI_004784 [Halioglobus sp.]|jgi:hypothetical protein